MIIMGFEEDVEQTDKLIAIDYRNSISVRYDPLFERIKDKAIPHMEIESISEIPLGITYGSIVFKKDGKFYEYPKSPGVDNSLNLIDLAKAYQKESDYIAGQADSRGHITPDICSAMKNAVMDFRRCVQKSLVDSI
jgi:hypothetical protein